MSIYRKFYAMVVGPAISVFNSQKSEDAQLESRSITKLRAISLKPARLSLVERLRHAFAAKAELANNQDTSSATSNSSLTSVLKPAVPLTSSTKEKGSGLGLGVDSLAAIAQVKEKDTAARRARVTSTRLTALKNYLEQGAN